MASPPPFHQFDFDNQDDPLALTLGLPHSSWTTSPVPPPQQITIPLVSSFQSQPLYDLIPTSPYLPQYSSQMETPNLALNRDMAGPSSRSRQARRARSKTRGNGKSETIPPPYPWAQDRRSMIHSLQYLVSNGITKISGEVKCKRCDKQYEMEYDLVEKFTEIASYISRNKSSMHTRAPSEWMNPTLPDCEMCDQSNCVRPVLTKKRVINWLFLLLGKMLGCCKLSELKYFCKHTENHRTGAKDRVLYLTYLGLCKQLDPCGPFDIDL